MMTTALAAVCAHGLGASGWLRVVATAMALGLYAGLPAAATSITEPATVFYGKIIGTASAQPFTVTEGTLEWIIRRADGTDLFLRAPIAPLNGGAYSYRLDVPHEVLTLGLGPSLVAVPLKPAVETHSHGRILVDGVPAKIAAPNGAAFEVSQARRAATYRLDLLVPLTPRDTDGDGVPDWWEDRFDLDKQEATDALTDADGDGLSNLQEYLQGADPTWDNRQPELVTSELIGYADGTTGIWLRVIDIDSESAALVFTLTRAPKIGALYIRHSLADPAKPDGLLQTGSTFTQQDIHDGRIVFVHPGSHLDSVSFDLSLRDENLNHEAARGTVRIHFYRPPTAIGRSESAASLIARVADGTPLPGFGVDEELRVRSYLLSRELGYIIWDGSARRVDQRIGAPSSTVHPSAYSSVDVARSGADRAHVLIGGSGQDRLSGGRGPDILVGGAGDDVLRGNSGSDRFVFYRAHSGHDIIEDFNPMEHDRIDLGRVLRGESTRLRDYIQVTSSRYGATLKIDADGDGSGFTDMAITLAGLAAAEVVLPQWLEQGYLVAPELQSLPRVTILAHAATASENGPRPGTLTLSRYGSLDTALTVQLAVGGSATNGSDFSKLPNTGTFPAGESRLELEVLPFADSQDEPVETVEVEILPGDGYEVGTPRLASMTIEDLQAVVSIEALEPKGVKKPLTPAVFLVTRSAFVDRSLLVRLNIEGSATNAVDYQRLLKFINLMPGQTTALIEIVPTAGALLDSGAKTVEISIVPDPAYRVGASGWARVVLVEQG